MSWDAAKQALDGNHHRWLGGLPILGGIWLAQAGCDRLWLALDRSVPAWDDADYLTGSLIYWQALQTPHLFSSDWWTQLWLLSSKIPPLVYISTAPFISLFGGEPDRALLVFLLYSAILLGSVYTLGYFLFNTRVGLWAAGLCVLMPTLYHARLEFLLDYPLSAMVTLCFACLTLWRGAERQEKHEARGKDEEEVERGRRGEVEHSVLSPPSSALSTAFYSSLSTLHSLTFRPFTSSPTLLLALFIGITLGLALMTKQSAVLFLLVPIAWVMTETIWQRAWLRLGQLGLALLVSLPVWLPWYRTNWLLILTSSKRATIDSAAIEGAPSLLTLDAWTLYLRRLPIMVTVPLLVVPLLGLGLFWRRSRMGVERVQQDYAPKPLEYRQQVYDRSRQALIWLTVFLVGSYLLSTLNPNKDDRYVAPYLPVLSVVLAYGLTLLPRSWRLVQWGSVALAIVLMVATLFPRLPHGVNLNSSPPYQGRDYPLEQVVAQVQGVSPYLRSTIGVVPSTPEINQHNVNYYGLLQNFQVYGRQVGTRRSYLEQDRRSLSWFLTKTGAQGSIRQPDIQAAFVSAIETRGDFKLHQSWTLPDNSLLKLYRRRVAAIDVKEANVSAVSPASISPAPIQLSRIGLPAQAPPGQAIPVTYEWLGSWKDLQSGLVLLTWHKKGSLNQNGDDRWLHDHSIGMGRLYASHSPPAASRFAVTERTAMLPPKNLEPGTYTLAATYLNRQTGRATPIAVPPVTLRIDPNAAPTPAPELDLVTQLQSLAATLPQGTRALDRLSNEISRINQYDPIQDYLVQAQQAMTYRLQQEPRNRQYAYTLALAGVLKRQVKPAIAALQRVTQLDANNPYAYGYLAFVNLYDFRPRAAQIALDRALKLNSNLPEIHALSGVAALMRGNLLQAWAHAAATQTKRTEPSAKD